MTFSKHFNKGLEPLRFFSTKTAVSKESLQMMLGLEKMELQKITLSVGWNSTPSALYLQKVAEASCLSN